MKHSLKLLYRLWPRSAVPAEAVEPIVDLVNRGVSVAEIAREWLTAKRSRREMAPQQLEKIESGPGNGMGSEASNPQDVLDGRAADRRWKRRDGVGNAAERRRAGRKNLEAQPFGFSPL
jgi:hypothetical protein